MERNLISWNLPNLITVPLMAFIAFLIVGLAYQLFLGVSGGKKAAPANSPGF